MCLHPQPIGNVPEETARVAAAAFPKGNVYMTMRDKLGVFYEDQDFIDLFPSRGQPGQSPWRLTLITIMQFAENLTDRQAADAVRSRIDWKYALGLELTDPGFHFSILSDFRDRLLNNDAEQLLLDRMLARFQELKLLKFGGKQRTDSTHVVAAIRDMNRLEHAGETIRHVLNEIALLEPDWLKAQIAPEWFERYSQRFEHYRLPKEPQERMALAETIGADGMHLLSAIYHPSAPKQLRDEPAVETMRQIWIQLYYQEEGQTRWRPKGSRPANALQIASPYDADARNAFKRATKWTGYKVHLTETCDADSPLLITHVETTQATLQDIDVVEDVHASLADKDLLPSQHLVDAAYVSSDVLVTSNDLHSIDLVGPVRPDTSWQAKANQGFDLSHFVINWDTETVTCPAGKTSLRWHEGTGKHGKPNIRASFRRADCSLCTARTLCTSMGTHPVRILTFQRKKQQLALQSARERQGTEAFKALYRQRAGIEGTISQTVNAKGIRRSRYRGMAKTHLQHLATAAAINLTRVVDWLMEVPRAKTRVSSFAALAVSA